MPAALEMSITGEGRFATNPILVRYKRAATMMHANIRSLIIPLSSPEQDRGVAAFQPAAIAGRFPDWSNDIWYTYQDVGLEDRTYVNMVSE
ncbi:hypothetical protein OIU76_027261 [Salix suchowensis]|nr:hypothetical protein OIU76_027261 [Salix suchowensis]